MKKLNRNISNVSTTKTVTHIEAHGQTSIIHQSKSEMRTKDMSQYIHKMSCWKWRIEQTKCSQDMQINIMIAITKPRCTFSIPKIMALEVAG